MEDQKKLLQFVEWLGANVPELQGQAPEQIVSTINKLSESPEGQEMLQGLINEFESSMTGMFKKGGKLDYLLCLKKGGSIQDCGCGKKIEKAQTGRVLGSDQYPNVSRKEAIDAAMDMGFSRKQARNAYRNQLRGLSSVNGLSGKELKQNARWNMIDTAYPRATESTQPQNRELAPINSVASIDSPTTVTTSQSAGIIKPKLNTERPSLLTFTGQNFDSAFSNARKMGLSEFGWNGGRYTTELGTGVPDAYETNPVDLSTPNPSVSGATLPTSGWIAEPGYDPRVYQILKNEVANRRSKRK